jgi:hypothetical protein
MAISTKTTPSENGGGFIQKSLQPGVTKCVLHSIKLERLAYIKEREEYTLTMSLEGMPQGGSFVGFPKVFGDNAGQKFAGQQSFVKSSNWGYYNGKTQNGYDCSVQDSVLAFLKELATELGILSYWEGPEICDKYNTIQEIVEAFNRDKKYAGIWINYLLASRVYQNKAGYDAHDLHLIRSTKEGKAFSGDVAQVLKFDSTKHIYRPKPKTLENGFEAKKEEPAKTGISTKVSATPITDEMLKESTTQSAKIAAPDNQSKADFLKEIEAVGEKVEEAPWEETSDIVTEGDGILPFSLD